MPAWQNIQYILLKHTLCCWVDSRDFKDLNKRKNEVRFLT